MIEQDWLQYKGKEVDQRRGKEVGANIYNPKPFDPDELFETVAKISGLTFS
jgi:DNA-binding response OmpR family regulator